MRHADSKLRWSAEQKVTRNPCMHRLRHHFPILKPMPEHWLGCHFPLDFWQTHSQMAHKGAFSKPESILTALLGCFTGAPIVPLARNNPDPPCREGRMAEKIIRGTPRSTIIMAACGKPGWRCISLYCNELYTRSNEQRSSILAQLLCEI